MDSADEALYCDFCKEPFAREKKSATNEAPKAAAPAPAPAAIKIPNLNPSAVPGKLVEGLPKEVSERLRQTLEAAPEEELPKAPSWLRPAAYAFLALWMFWGVVLMAWMLAKKQASTDPALRPSTSEQSE